MVMPIGLFAPAAALVPELVVDCQKNTNATLRLPREGVKKVVLRNCDGYGDDPRARIRLNVATAGIKEPHLNIWSPDVYDVLHYRVGGYERDKGDAPHLSSISLTSFFNFPNPNRRTLFLRPDTAEQIFWMSLKPPAGHEIKYPEEIVDKIPHLASAPACRTNFKREAVLGPPDRARAFIHIRGCKGKKAVITFGDPNPYRTGGAVLVRSLEEFLFNGYQIDERHRRRDFELGYSYAGSLELEAFGKDRRWEGKTMTLIPTSNDQVFIISTLMTFER